ncbi:MAG: hypothetical protein AAB340_01340 [Patescibacteria group bacterium]
MKTERELQVREQEQKTLGHEIEHKVGEFITGSFDCVVGIEKTANHGINDKKGIDMVVEFENGNKMAIDVTSDVGARVNEKIKSMRRSLLVSIAQEKNNEGQITVEKSEELVPRALIRADSYRWEEYNIERINDEIIVYMPDKIRVQEEKDILQQLVRQIDYFSKEDMGYKNKTSGIKEMLKTELQELEKIEKEFN